MVSKRNINLLNIGLILVSLLLAYLIPFRLFLFSYAVLGPLHYLTEINWLHERKYWVRSVNWLLVGSIITAGIALPHVLMVFEPNADSLLGKAAFFLSSISNGLIFLSLAASAVFVLVKDLVVKVILLFFFIGLAFILNDQPVYTLIIGLMIPTVLHVFVFTALFMLYGAKKTKNPLEYLGFYLMLLAPLLIIWLDVDPSNLSLTDRVKESYSESGFHITLAQFGKALGIMDGTSFFFHEKTEMKLQIFIAFAYLYHYLNWFTKTTTIGWHKSLNGKRTLAILAIWATIVTTFAISYGHGFICALFFSFLHVVLEFPLNVVSIRGILKPE
jgi:hypothetical protein